ncbi:MAG: DHH family phosphoesterase, partial [Candidatus Omnitrophota bacterium]
MRKNWNTKKQEISLQEELSKTLSVSFLSAQLLINRGIRDARAARFFMKPSLLSLYDPFLMKDMEKAVARIKDAIAKKERIFVYGDYDVDGICSTALIYLVLREMGADPEYYIPNRLEEGYGLNKDAISDINDKGVDLLITVDCGITALEEVRELNKLGIDVIITDHHTADAQIPDAFAVLDPMRMDCSYPDKSLAGVGVAFKLATALLGKESDFLYEQLDIVCLATIADVVPVIGENRILVKNGLHQLSHTKKLGLKALVEAASIKDGSNISSYHVGYILAPRINATGRLGSADIALKLILSEDEVEANVLASQLNDENKSRQTLEAKVLKEALAKV